MLAYMQRTLVIVELFRGQGAVPFLPEPSLLLLLLARSLRASRMLSRMCIRLSFSVCELHCCSSSIALATRGDLLLCSCTVLWDPPLFFAKREDEAAYWLVALLLLLLLLLTLCSSGSPRKVKEESFV